MKAVRMWAVVISVVGSLNLGASCLGVKDVTNTIDSAADKTVAVIDEAIRAIQGSSASWQTALQDAQQKLTADAQATVRNEIANLLQDSIGVANAGIFCTVDFVAQRIIQGLGRIKNLVLGKPPPNDLSPSICEA